ncbi:hypothetical protein DXO181_09855 [Xanthomonas oryzae pv. oryzae]|nr:hypothetical protein DXO181_09855 [Xanthomonas oryzae pv. oryzae]
MAGLLTKKGGAWGGRESKGVGKPLAADLGAQRRGRRRAGGRAGEGRGGGGGGGGGAPLLG